MKKALFFENAGLLAERFGIIPLMYGSLGLEYITGEKLGADDIDILIPEAFIMERWNELKDSLEEEGYVLIDEHEHTFQKDDVHYSYASLEELEGFAGIKLPEIKLQTEEGVTFRILSLEQYLKVYMSSVKDGYRINVRCKKDKEKIAFIKERLKGDGEEFSNEN